MNKTGPKPKYDFKPLLDDRKGYVEFSVKGLTFQKAYSKYVSIRNSVKRFVKRQGQNMETVIYLEDNLIVVEAL